MPHVSGLFRYPIKSCGAESLESMMLGPLGSLLIYGDVNQWGSDFLGTHAQLGDAVNVLR